VIEAEDLLTRNRAGSEVDRASASASRPQGKPSETELRMDPGHGEQKGGDLEEIAVA
jgi:hypothetical protein